jgi:carnosine N-methyltransferase
MPTAHWQLLAAPPFNILSKFDRVDDAIDANAAIASSVLESGLHIFGLQKEPVDPAMEWRGTARPSDMDKTRTTIRQLYRDWSVEGAKEREHSYGPVLLDLARLFPTQNKSLFKILVPGSGLGRLLFEVFRMGFDAEGNEVSYHPLLTSNWILNQLPPDQHFDLYPFALSFSNHISLEQQMKCVKIPDINPSKVLGNPCNDVEVSPFGKMNVIAADFVVAYGDDSQRLKFDAVVTVFFLDTAPNVLRYIEVIRNCLNDGGYWINLGPLLWHFEEERQHKGGGDKSTRDGKHHEDQRPHENNLLEGIAEPGNVELTNEEVLLLIERMGFTIEIHEIIDECGYIQDWESMTQNTYRVSHWVARKSG